MPTLPDKSALGFADVRAVTPGIQVPVDPRGAAMQNLGQAVQGLGGEMMAAKQKADEFDAESRFIAFQDQQAKALSEAQKAAPPGALDFESGVRANFRKAGDEFYNTLPPTVREKYKPKLQTFESNVAASARRFETEESSRNAIALTDGKLTDLSNRIGGAATKDALTPVFDDVKRQGEEYIGTAPLTPIQQEAVRKKFQQSLHDAYWQKAIKLDPRAALDELGTPSPGSASIVDKIVGVESGGDPNAKNPNSSATGAGQFIDSTWLSMMRKYHPEIATGRSDAEILSFRKDPTLSKEMVGRYAEENGRILGDKNLDATPANLYLAHFLGPGGAVALLSVDPSTPVSKVLGADQIAANRSILEGKTAEQVQAWAEKKMAGTEPVSNNPLTAGLSFNRIEQLRAAAQAQIGDDQRAIALQKDAEKRASDARELDVFKDIHSNAPKLSAMDILNDTTLSKEAKEKLFNLKANVTGGAREDRTYGRGFYDAYQRVHAPDGDPNKITDPSSLYSRVGPNGDLTVAGVDKLAAEIAGRRTPEGVAESDMKKQFFTMAKSQISGSDEGLRIKDPKGDELYLKFMAQAMPAYEAGRKAGKTPSQLLNPTSPDYVGKMIGEFKRPMNQWFSDVIQDQSAAAPAAKPPPEIKSLDELVAAYRAGTVTKAQADEMAVARGWATRKPRVPISGAPEAPRG